MTISGMYIFLFGSIIGFGFFIKQKLRSIYLILLMYNLFVLRAYFSPAVFVDYENYTFICTKLMNSGLRNIGLYEISSKLLLFIPVKVTNDVYIGIYLSYLLIMLSGILFFVLVAQKHNIKYENILITLSVFAPLLFFVTIRATIPYLLVAWLYLDNFRLNLKNALLLVLALSFHISTGLVIISLIIIRSICALEKDNMHYHLCFFGITFSCALLIRIFNFDSYAMMLQSFLPGNLAIYKVFFNKVHEFNTSLHFIYMLIVFGFVLALLVAPKGLISEQHLKQALIFCGCFFLFSIAPVIAYRFSIFFILPLLLAINLQQLSTYTNPAAKVTISLITVVLFVVNFNYVILPTYR